jgi:UPF0042 nucleotide-binding protein
MGTSGKMKVVLITGLSGAGKTNAADWFEDQGYYCIDNMPPSLIKNFLELTSFTPSASGINKAAFVVDIRSDEFFSGLHDTLEYLKKEESVEFKILFIEASNSTLIKRYNETRRNHPLSNGSTSEEVINKEREMLSELRARADYHIDTTGMKVSEFNGEMDKIFAESRGSSAFAINIISFGYKHGIPQDTDLVFDMRFIPNPFYVQSLKHLTGKNKKVSQYVMKHEVTKQFIAQLDQMINTIAPCYKKEGKYHLNIAFGCTGGQHRSVAMAIEMANRFKKEGYRVTLEHREL